MDTSTKSASVDEARRMSVDHSKSALRTQALRARKKMATDEREFASLQVCDLIAGTGVFRRAKRIAVYLPTGTEINTWPFIERAWRMKKRVFAPIVKKNRVLQFCELGPKSELSANPFGIPEPDSGKNIPSQQLDLVITPLVAFDEYGNRIGMGGGYYDRTFSFLNGRNSFQKPKLIGVAFECQRVNKIHASHWDIPLFRVVTESGEQE